MKLTGRGEIGQGGNDRHHSNPGDPFDHPDELGFRHGAVALHGSDMGRPELEFYRVADH